MAVAAWKSTAHSILLLLLIGRLARGLVRPIRVLAPRSRSPQPRTLHQTLDEELDQTPEEQNVDAVALRALFEATRATGALRVDDGDAAKAAASDYEDDDGFPSLLTPAAAAPVSAEERDAFMERLNLKELVDEEYKRASDAVHAAAAATLEEQSADVRRAVDEAFAETKTAELDALREMESQVEFLMAKVAAREETFEAAVADARRAADEMAAYEQQASLFTLGAGLSALLLALSAFVVRSV